MRIIARNYALGEYMISQIEADEMLQTIKSATRKDTFFWRYNERFDEIVIADNDEKLIFVLSLKKNEFEIRLNFRSKNKQIVLARVDSQKQHFNPDGTKITGPHLHLYKEGYAEKWATPINWYNIGSPIDTLTRFLEVINTRFPNGYAEDLL